tara:strand:- start:1034 stop:1258 length:225 start_codon:yes stop_codon:yes gene_type:complete
MTSIDQLDLERINELELQIKEIDLALEVSNQLIRNNPHAFNQIKSVARRQIWILQAEIDKIIDSDPKIEEEEEE